MLTRKELCQVFLLKAQQKFGKSMTEIDIYYAGPEVGLALHYLGLVHDRDSLRYIQDNPDTMFKHPNGKELSFTELLQMLPDDTVSAPVLEKSVECLEAKDSYSGKTECEIKELLGERKYYRLLDAIETLEPHESAIVTQLMNLKFSSVDPN